MKILSQSENQLILKQTKSGFGKFTGAVCVLLSLIFLVMIIISSDFNNVGMYIFLTLMVIVFIVGLFLLRQKKSDIVVTVDKGIGTIDCQAEPSDIMQIQDLMMNPPTLAINDITCISEETSPFGFILKNGKIV